MDPVKKPCSKEGDLFVACVNKHKFVPPCITLILEWDKCMVAYQKLSVQASKVELQPTQQNA